MLNNNASVILPERFSRSNKHNRVVIYTEVRLLRRRQLNDFPKYHPDSILLPENYSQFPFGSADQLHCCNQGAVAVSLEPFLRSIFNYLNYTSIFFIVNYY